MEEFLAQKKLKLTVYERDRDYELTIRPVKSYTNLDYYTSSGWTVKVALEDIVRRINALEADVKVTSLGDTLDNLCERYSRKD